MNTTVLKIGYALLMIILIVGVDMLFLRDLPWARLASNVGIVLLFGALYFRLFGGSSRSRQSPSRRSPSQQDRE